MEKWPIARCCVPLLNVMQARIVHPIQRKLKFGGLPAGARCALVERIKNRFGESCSAINHCIFFDLENLAIGWKMTVFQPLFQYRSGKTGIIEVSPFFSRKSWLAARMPRPP